MLVIRDGERGRARERENERRGEAATLVQKGERDFIKSQRQITTAK